MGINGVSAGDVVTFDIGIWDNLGITQYATATVTVHVTDENNNEEGIVSSVLSVSDVTVTEGGVAEVTVSLSAPPVLDLSVSVSTQNGTATASNYYGSTGDYESAWNDLTFTPDGPLSQTASIQTNPDNPMEGEEGGCLVVRYKRKCSFRSLFCHIRYFYLL